MCIFHKWKIVDYSAHRVFSYADYPDVSIVFKCEKCDKVKAKELDYNIWSLTAKRNILKYFNLRTRKSGGYDITGVKKKYQPMNAFLAMELLANNIRKSKAGKE